MKRVALTLLAISALFLAACSSDEPSITDKVADKVDQINTENADAIVTKIKTPINKARLSQELGDERTRSIEEAMKNQ